MSIPNYQDFMRPMLEVIADGREWASKDLKEAVATRVGLTEADRAEMLPSGRQLTYLNRIGWAQTYLSKAGLLNASRRGWIRITDRGREVLVQGHRIDARFLLQFEEFQQFKSRAQEPTEAKAQIDQDDATPDERLDQLYGSIRDDLGQELLEVVLAGTPAFFERLVVKLLVAMGYGGSSQDAGRAIGQSGDGGIDGIIKQDRLGVDNVFIQAKKWAPDRPVGSGEVRNLSGALAMHKATKGVLITTSYFTESARDAAKQIGNIVLVDGEQLAELMIDYNVGVSLHKSYELKRIDQDFFDDI